MFSLTYCMEGMTYDSVMEMEPDDRLWYVDRLLKQLKKENEEIKKASAKNKGRGSSKSRR